MVVFVIVVVVVVVILVVAVLVVFGVVIAMVVELHYRSGICTKIRKLGFKPHCPEAGTNITFKPAVLGCRGGPVTLLRARSLGRPRAEKSKTRFREGLAFGV